MSDELKPCPFCGHPGEIEHSGEPGMLWVGCMVDDPDICMYRPMTYVTDAELADAVAAWNRRVPAQGVPVEVLSVIEVALEQYKERQLERNDKGRFALALDALAWLNAQAQEGDA